MKYKKLYDEVVSKGTKNIRFKNIEIELNNRSTEIVEKLNSENQKSDSGIGDVIAFIFEIAASIVK